MVGLVQMQARQVENQKGHCLGVTAKLSGHTIKAEGESHPVLLVTRSKVSPRERWSHSN